MATVFPRSPDLLLFCGQFTLFQVPAKHSIIDPARPNFVPYGTKFGRAGSMIECFAGTWKSVNWPQNNSKSGDLGKTVAIRHIFQDLPMLQSFVPYETKGCQAAKMNCSWKNAQFQDFHPFTIASRLWFDPFSGPGSKPPPCLVRYFTANPPTRTNSA